MSKTIVNLTPNPSPKRRGERIPKILNDWPSLSLQERETEGEVISEASTSQNSTPLVPSERSPLDKLPFGNAISGDVPASLCETKFREQVTSQVETWDAEDYLTPQPLSYEERGAMSENFGVQFPLSFQERGLGGEVISEASTSPSEVNNPTLNIGLFGFGCVGQGLYDVLNHSQGLKASIGKICVKDKSKPRTIDMDCFTFNKHEVLENTRHNLIVELTSDADAALEIITGALAKGQSVVTAGKKVLAENFELLYRLQQQTGASLLYEAACAGSIPIIRTLEEYYDNELLSSVKGILNGSSNYILSKMEFDKLTYHDALKQAQLAGFAEADPALDVNGTDAKYKLCLLAAHAFGIIVKPSYIFNSGIQNITPFDITYAAQNNCRIKLIAGIAKDNGGYRAYVLPKFVSRENPLSNINYEFNGIEVEGVYSDKQFFVGKGAGSHPTGSAVLSDISAITYDYKYGYKKLKKRADLTPQPLSWEERGAMSESFGVKSQPALSFLRLPAVTAVQEGKQESLTIENEALKHTLNIPDPAKQKRGTAFPLCDLQGVAKSAGGVGATPYSVLTEEGEVPTNFSQDHRFLESDFTLRLYIRYHDTSREALALLDITSIEEEYTSAKGNYIIANVGFKSLFNLLNTPNDLFVCGFLPY